MTHNTETRLAGDHTVVKPTIILLSTINIPVSAANGGQNLQTLLRFIQDLHPGANHQYLIQIPGTHGECKPTGQTPSMRETTPLEYTKSQEPRRRGTTEITHPFQIRAHQR